MEEWERLMGEVYLELNVQGSISVGKNMLDRRAWRKVQRKDIFSHIQGDDKN